MREYAEKALDYLDGGKVDYADVRVIDSRERHIATKNGKMADASSEESLGMGIRVLLKGSWGFAATDNFSADSVAATAARAVEIARASAGVKKADVVLAPAEKIVDTWSSPFRAGTGRPCAGPPLPPQSAARFR